VNLFALGIAAVHAQKFSEAELHAALHACLDANVKLVTSSLEEKVVLSELVVRIAG
jgi:DNA polymerase-3 subunit delta